MQMKLNLLLLQNFLIPVDCYVFPFLYCLFITLSEVYFIFVVSILVRIR